MDPRSCVDPRGASTPDSPRSAPPRLRSHDLVQFIEGDRRHSAAFGRRRLDEPLAPPLVLAHQHAAKLGEACPGSLLALWIVMRSRPNRSRLRSGVPGRLVGVGDCVRTFPLPHSRASMASARQARDRSLGGGQPRRVSREVSRPRGDLPHPLRDRLRRVRSSVRRCWSGDERRWLPARASNRRFRRASQHPRGISRGRSDMRERLRAVLAAARTGNERAALARVMRGEPIARHEKALQVALWRLRRKLAG